MDVNSELRILIQKRFRTLSAFCELSDIKESTLKMALIRGIVTIKADTLVKMCTALRIDPISLMHGEIKERKQSLTDMTSWEYTILSKIRDTDKVNKDIIAYILSKDQERNETEKKTETVFASECPQIPARFQHMAVAAGFGEYLDSDYYDDVFIYYRPELRKTDIILRIVGDSMEPTYSDNDIVAVELKKELNYGDVGIFIIGNDGFIKEYGQRGLISHNGKYKMIRPTEEKEIRTVGKVLGKAEIVR